MIQLTDENTVVEISKKGVAEFEAFTPDYLMEKMGITPAQFIDLKALMGDKSDNIPGVTKTVSYTHLDVYKRQALILSSLTTEKIGHLPQFKWMEILATVPTVIVAFKSKNLLYAVIVGIISMALIRFVF